MINLHKYINNKVEIQKKDCINVPSCPRNHFSKNQINRKIKSLKIFVKKLQKSAWFMVLIALFIKGIIMPSLKSLEQF